MVPDAAFHKLHAYAFLEVFSLFHKEEAIIILIYFSWSAVTEIMNSSSEAESHINNAC